MELHLTLGGMNVHVHGGGIDFQKQTAHRITPLHQRRVIALHQGEIDTAILDRATINEDVLILARGTGDAGRTDQTPDAK